MLSKNFMIYYISFLTMAITVLIIGPIYFYGTIFLACYVNEDYQQAMAITLGVIAVATSYQMMAVIEREKIQLIEEIEERVDRFLR